MKTTFTRFLFVAALAAVFAGPLAGRATAEEETELGREMEQLADAYKELRKGLKAPDPAQAARYRELSQAIVAHAEAAALLEPALAEKQAGAAQEKMVAEFQQGMGRFAEKAKALDGAVAAGDFEKAAKLAAELNDLKKEGHEKFQEEE
jgi:soluble cytochrome b562